MVLVADLTKEEFFEQSSAPFLTLPIVIGRGFPQQMTVNIDNRGYTLVWRWIEGAYDSPETTITPTVHLRILRLFDNKIMFNGILYTGSEIMMLHPVTKWAWGWLRADTVTRDTISVYLLTYPTWLVEAET